MYVRSNNWVYWTRLLRLLAVSMVVGHLQGCGGLFTRVTGGSDGSSETARKEALYRQYSEWKGTRYRLGGLSKQGIDCSGLVYLTYRSKFGITLPRTTRNQSAQGVMVSRQELRPGDLLFFRTGNDKRHVGIFVEQRKFLHASSSKGVMLSSLDNRYWSNTYWTARRIE